MTADHVAIGTLAPDELETTVDWAAREGWNPGLSDAACFRVADPGGFLGARLDGRLVGSISLVHYGSEFGFLGLYIVEPDLRGRGIGTRLWSAALERRGQRIVGLDGVVAMQPSYARSGFVLAHRNIRYGGVPDAGGLPGARDAAVSGTVELGAADLPEVAAYDEPCFGARREQFLRAWLEQPGARTVGVRGSAGPSAGLMGYGTIRPCRTGWKVGPLFAEDVEVAAALLARLLDHAQASGPAEVFLDVPEPHRRAVQLAEGLGLTPRFETARMYAGGDPGLPLTKVFGITSFELG